jgi:hypothetical protein
MQNFSSSDLSDPQPPVPGERERSLVAARAHQLGRRRRMLQGAGALGVVAAVTVSVAALTAGGSSGPGASRVEAANATVETTDVAPTTVPATTVPPTADTTAPAPAPDTAPPAAEQAPPATADTTPVVTPAAPSTFTLSGTVTGNPAGTTVTVTLQSAAGTFTATADGAGNFSISGLPAGDYLAVGQWVDSTGTATQAAKFGSVTISGDSSVSFSFPPSS